MSSNGLNGILPNGLGIFGRRVAYSRTGTAAEGGGVVRGAVGRDDRRGFCSALDWERLCAYQDVMKMLGIDRK